MEGLEGIYEPESLSLFTREERQQLETLHKQLDGLYDAICDRVAAELGITDVAQAKQDAERNQVITDRASELIEEWDEQVDMKDLSDNPPAKFARIADLLTQHHEVSDQIQDISDTALIDEREERLVEHMVTQR